jgi:hypothetical protein
MDGRQQLSLIIRSKDIGSQHQTPLDRNLLFEDVQRIVVPKRPHFFIVDLRFNGDGNFFDTDLFAQALPKLMLADGRIFALISRATYSATLANAAMMKSADPNNVTFIGEPMGDNGQFWAEPGTKTLPNSGFAVQYSTEFEDYERGYVDLAKCYWPTVAFEPTTSPLSRISGSTSHSPATRPAAIPPSHKLLPWRSSVTRVAVRLFCREG